MNDTAQRPQAVDTTKKATARSLQDTTFQLQEVEISTGYESIPRERATGSFVQVDNQLLNRSVSTNLLDRLKDVTSGLNFTNVGSRQTGQSPIEIRGRATLFSNAEPLIILDNFPYDGDFGNINPNDIESITVLKDAAAASAWGARAGNGVIVITTKSGRLNSMAKVNFNANVNIGEKPDLYYRPQLTSGEFIEVQQYLFDRGAYDGSINGGFSQLPEAVEIFLARRNGTISEADSIAQINALKDYDIREQLLEYYYRPSVNQQYQVGINGGTTTQKYFVSVGYDKNISNTANSDYQRLTLNANNTYYFFGNRLELFAGILYTNSNTNTGRDIQAGYPYSQIADADGNPLVVANVLRPSYAATAGDGKLLDWLYRPLDEIRNNYGSPETNLSDYRINTTLGYTIIDGLRASLLYNYQKGVSESSTLNELESFFTRNEINRLTQINESTGTVIHPIPLGGILSNAFSSYRSHSGRFQLNYGNTMGKHAINAIAGTEIKDYSTFRTQMRFYGYDPETANNQNAAVNYTATYPNFYGNGTSRIATGSSQSGNTDRFFSYYFNGSYTYSERYIASISARKDESNLFGVSANQKGVPLWSVGTSWIINKEGFYHLEQLPQLKLRLTYGYTGNVNNSLSAYLTSQITNTAHPYNSIQSVIINPPNPSLRWEKVRNLNLGLDFGTKGNRISGSIDYWQKVGLDLIGNSPIAPQTGIVLFTGNSANTLTKGLDLELNTINLNGEFKWYTTWLYNHSRSEVTEYKVSNGSNFNVVSANYNNPLEGYPYYAVFSFPYAGLSGSGDPQGYLNGEISTNYTAIRNSVDREELEFHGSAIPTSFGSIRNTFSYGAFDLSFNIGYKLGYYFRRSSLNTNLYSVSGSHQMAEYGKRWQNPGDELTTDVPALIYPNNTNRGSIYTYSSTLIERGDHIRLQDIRLGFSLNRLQALPVRSLNLFVYANNMGIIWKANDHHIDPDYFSGATIPAARTFAVGLRADL